MRHSATDSGNQIPVVLASQSPRRRELLSLIGIAHEVLPAGIDESLREAETPEQYCLRLAETKARVIADSCDDTMVIGSDTIVVLDGDILGKPRDRAEASRMLGRLSGRSHVVHTAVAVSWRQRMLSGVESVRVRFRELDADLIEAYANTGEPDDKAGAYGIQGFGATIIERVEGDYFAVMGLPVGLLVELIRKHGLHYRFGPVTL